MHDCTCIAADVMCALCFYVHLCVLMHDCTCIAADVMCALCCSLQHLMVFMNNREEGVPLHTLTPSCVSVVQ